MPFARIGLFDVPPHQLASVVTHFRDRVTSAFATHDGFLGYQALVDENAGRYVGISYWTSLTALEGSTEAALRAREEAEALGAQILGEPMICREEFDTRAASVRAGNSL